MARASVVARRGVNKTFGKSERRNFSLDLRQEESYMEHVDVIDVYFVLVQRNRDSAGKIF